MGLGTFPSVPLKEVRSEAETWRKVAKEDKDPIKQREADKRAAMRNMHILRDVADDACESHKTSLKGDGKAGRWMSPLELHVLPVLVACPSQK